MATKNDLKQFSDFVEKFHSIIRRNCRLLNVVRNIFAKTYPNFVTRFRKKKIEN